MQLNLEEIKKTRDYFINLANEMESQEKLKRKGTEVKETLQEKIIGEKNERENYFFIDCNKDIHSYQENYTDIDNDLYNSFNYFKNEEEAEKHAKHELLSLKLIRLRDKLNGDWIPDWDNDFECKYFIDLSYNNLKNNFYYTHKSSNLYFKTEELRDEFLKLIPENEILEYLRF